MKLKNLVPAVALALLATLDLQSATAFAQSTVFTYQGRVTDHGTNFNGAGQFKFAPPTPVRAQSAERHPGRQQGRSP